MTTYNDPEQATEMQEKEKQEKEEQEKEKRESVSSSPSSERQVRFQLSTDSGQQDSCV